MENVDLYMLNNFLNECETVWAYQPKKTAAYAIESNVSKYHYELRNISDYLKNDIKGKEKAVLAIIEFIDILNKPNAISENGHYLISEDDISILKNAVGYSEKTKKASIDLD